MSDHLGYDRHDPVGRDGGNSRNGVRSKTVLTEIGPVEIEVPRDRDRSFDPHLVHKRQRRLDGIDEIVLSLTARHGSGAHRPDRRNCLVTSAVIDTLAPLRRKSFDEVLGRVGPSRRGLSRSVSATSMWATPSMC
jgi:hypothetical protein